MGPPKRKEKKTGNLIQGTLKGKTLGNFEKNNNRKISFKVIQAFSNTHCFHKQNNVQIMLDLVVSRQHENLVIQIVIPSKILESDARNDGR